MKIGAVITAAGMSSRMGTFKPMLSIGSISVAQRIIATLQQSGVSQIVVVTGYNADVLERHLAKSGVIFLRNENYENTEMFDSACIGLRYLRKKCSRILFTPVDIPLFRADTVEKLIKKRSDVVFPICAGQQGHPILLSSRIIDLILDYSGEGGLAGALENLDISKDYVFIEDRGILFDADTPEEFEKLLEYHNSQLTRPVIKLSLEKEKRFFDRNIALLLELIDETRSVKTACQRMQISYSKGWKTLNSIEDQAGFALVLRKQGGSRGGGTSLTPEGKLLLERYRKYEQAVKEASVELFDKYLSDVLK
ncbi:MAG: NTP transferase domain-containing protein [Tissierellia bacterium]|nr:NTP transferase domain-containing protein [Bacillota bacterium]NLL22980.1 NTP transferase domain-containing protein [Tissierellia bacterium]